MAHLFIKKTLSALENITELKIRTLVGEFEYEPVKNNESYQFHLKKGAPVEGMVSKINLVLGDIDTEISPKFVNEYAALREFHEAKEKQGHEIIKKNMEVIREIAKTIAELTKPETNHE